MGLIKTIQNQPREVKIKIMWAIAALVAIFLIVIWIISYKFYKRATPDNTVSKAFTQGIQDVKDNFGKK